MSHDTCSNRADFLCITWYNAIMKNIVYIDGQNFLYKTSEILMKHGLILDKQDLHAINIRPMLEKLFPDEELEIRFFGVAKIKRRPDLGQEILCKKSR